MKKRLLAFVLLGCITLAIVACDDKGTTASDITVTSNDMTSGDPEGNMREPDDSSETTAQGGGIVDGGVVTEMGYGELNPIG